MYQGMTRKGDRSRVYKGVFFLPDLSEVWKSSQSTLPSPLASSLSSAAWRSETGTFRPNSFMTNCMSSKLTYTSHGLLGLVF